MFFKNNAEKSKHLGKEFYTVSLCLIMISINDYDTGFKMDSKLIQESKVLHELLWGVEIVSEVKVHGNGQD